MYKLIAFDFDGTLFESLTQCLDAFRKTVSPYAGHLLTDAEIEATFGLSEDGMIMRLVGDNWEQAAADFYAEYAVMHESITEVFDGARELLDELKEKGVRLALVTGKGETACRISLEKLRLEGVFEAVRCGEADGPSKHRHFGDLLKQYGFEKDEMVYIGDSTKDVEACRMAGIGCLSAAWQSDARKDALEAVNSGLVFESVAALREYLLKHI